MFVDRVQIRVEAGTGGNGCISFRREKYVPKGGPDGGDGGRGGHVILRSVGSIGTLLEFTNNRTYRATKGDPGSGNNRYGAQGADLLIRVPPGTLVVDGATGESVADFVEPGMELIVAHGGKGGRGNWHFATPTRQAPRYAEDGGEGETRDLVLELRLIADVGLVGLPNAGKSTLLSVVSAARPRIAPYPFTTRTPNLGLVRRDEQRSFVMADIPGLIEGAHEGKGLGHTFLRHISRTRVLCLLLEASSATGEDPVETYQLLLRELTCYDPDLLARPQVVCLTKTDLLQAAAIAPLVASLEARGVPGPVMAISAVTGQGIPEILQRLGSVLDALPAQVPSVGETETEVTFGPTPPATPTHGR